MSDLEARIQKHLPGIPPDVVHQSRQNWQETNIIRRILVGELNRIIEGSRSELENCPRDEVEKVRGTIAGIRRAIATINEIGLKP